MAEAASFGDGPRGHVMLVDDDSFFRESLCQNLMDAGFTVEPFADGTEVMAALENGQTADLMLLDWKMPELSGIEVLRRMREEEIELPVIFLTVLSDQIYEEAGLLGGAVDFVEKARSFSILLKRIELSLGNGRSSGGREDGGGDEDLQLGALELRPASHEVLWQGETVPLTIGEFQIVDLLVRRAGSDVGYRDIYDVVRGRGFIAGAGPEGHRQNVRTFIKRIRGKFREVDPTFDQIGNYPGFGYRWIADDG